MKRSREESEFCTNGVLEEVQLPPLGLILTPTPEFISLIELSIRQHYAFLNQQNLPLEIFKKPGKINPVNFPISKITIGGWTRTAVYSTDLMAKFYFQKKKLMWEMLDNVEVETGVPKLKRKIEMLWSDVLSFKPSFHSHDGTGILEVELNNRPTFFIETNQKSKTCTQWKQLDQDFTQDQYAFKCRRHTLHFAPGVLQTNLKKLFSSDKFWSELLKVNFPTLENPYFQNGFGHVGVGKVNFNMANQYNVNDGRQMSSFVQDSLHNTNVANQVHWTQVIPQPIVNNHYGEIGRFITESQFNNPMFQEDSQLRGRQVDLQALLETHMSSFVQDSLHNTNAANQVHGTQVISQPINDPYDETGRYIRESRFNIPMIQENSRLLGSQVDPQALLETQTNSVHMNNDLAAFPEVGPYLQSVFDKEGEMQRNMVSFDQLGEFDYYDQDFSNNNGSMPPDL